jgi:hypothetical protein
MYPWVMQMIIDEQGIFQLAGKHKSDHSTIIVNIKAPSKPFSPPQPQFTWRITPETKMGRVPNPTISRNPPAQPK